METPRYSHTQPGTLMRVTLLAMLIAAVVTMLVVSPKFRGYSIVMMASLIVAGTMALCLLLFHSLTVTVTDLRLAWGFGAGVIKREIPLENISECKPVTNPWYYGWGIHLTPRGWLYNVSGFDAVEVSLRDGSVCRIGTDKPAELVAAIRQARNE